jgi:hypothetical protein
VKTARIGGWTGCEAASSKVDWNPLSLNVARLTLALAEAATRVTATEP